MPIDHFDGTDEGLGQQNFTIRYVESLEHVDNSTNAKTPIIFYAGNEGPIEAFWANSGFLTTTLAKELKGAVLFGEHRYYGESWPFNDKKKALEK